MCVSAKMVQTLKKWVKFGLLDYSLTPNLSTNWPRLPFNLSVPFNSCFFLFMNTPMGRFSQNDSQTLNEFGFPHFSISLIFNGTVFTILVHSLSVTVTCSPPS